MMEDKKGRKYDREKWGWKDESELAKHSFKPHYDNDRRNLTEKYSIVAIVVSIIFILLSATMIVIQK
tara:strand:+ start:771 stop:971 length:201 start_codon:yes stop_codon:yes gene_type:complete